MIIRVANRRPFVIIPKALLRDPGLSLEAKGFLAWLLCKPDNWSVYAAELASELGVSRKTIGRLLRELIKAGYVTRQALPWTHGSRRAGYEYTVRDSTVAQNDTQPLWPVTVSPNGPLLNPVTDSCKKDSAFKAFVEELFAVHLRATGARFVFLAKHGMMIKRLLKALGPEDAAARLRRYYSADTWFTRSGRSLEGFVAHVNEIPADPRPTPKKECPVCGSLFIGTMASCGTCGMEKSQISDARAVEEHRAWWEERERTKSASRAHLAGDDCRRLQTAEAKCST